MIDRIIDIAMLAPLGLQEAAFLGMAGMLMFSPVAVLTLIAFILDRK